MITFPNWKLLEVALYGIKFVLTLIPEGSIAPTNLGQYPGEFE